MIFWRNALGYWPVFLKMTIRKEACCMRYEVKVPQQGETTEYVTISKWTVKIGDKVKEGSELGEMESSKTTAPINSPFAGKIMELLKKEGDEADVGEVIAIIEG